MLKGCKANQWHIKETKVNIQKFLSLFFREIQIFIKIGFHDCKIFLISRTDSFPIIFTGTKFGEIKQNSQSLWNLISVKINSLKVTNW